jgi:hypothetical protein
MVKEYILCSAVWFDDGREYVHQPDNIERGYVICGRRHHNCFAILGQLLDEDKNYKTLEDVQGFLTSLNKFVDRKEAGIVAFNAGQTKELKETLYSEDLW